MQTIQKKKVTPQRKAAVIQRRKNILVGMFCILCACLLTACLTPYGEDNTAGVLFFALGTCLVFIH